MHLGSLRGHRVEFGVRGGRAGQAAVAEGEGLVGRQVPHLRHGAPGTLLNVCQLNEAS